MGPSDWNIYLLSGDKFENKVKFDLPPSFQIPNIGVAPIRVLGSAINGILCIYDYNGVPKTTVLWNPATEEIIEIPLG
ncbi:F-box family protein, partial [Trifolium medium]|nr:F-box family protein [Trifolium medium]